MHVGFSFCVRLQKPIPSGALFVLVSQRASAKPSGTAASRLFEMGFSHSSSRSAPTFAVASVDWPKEQYEALYMCKGTWRIRTRIGSPLLHLYVIKDVDKALERHRIRIERIRTEAPNEQEKHPV